MGDLVSGGINFTGLGSGTDFNAITEQLIEVESIQKQRLELWKAEWEDKVEALQQLNTAMLSLQTTLEGMDSPDEFLVKNAASTFPDYVSATADSSAEEAAHSIIVNQLAQNSIFVANSGVSNATLSLTAAAATFSYGYDDPDTAAGVQQVTVNVAAGTTLEGLRDLINNDPNNPGVRASVISDGNDYYLQLRGLDLGADANLFISNGTLTNFASADFTETQANQDSQIRVNGWPAASWIESSSNTVTDAITGVTLNLKETTGGSSVTVTVNVDNEAVKENVRTFVEQVNEVRTLIKDLTDFDDLKQEGSIMTGNYGVQLVSSALKSSLAAKAKGFEYYDDTGASATGQYFTSLSQLGILTNATEGSVTSGLLEIDEDTLNDALAFDPDAVARLFAADYEGDQIVESGSFSYYNHVVGMTEAGSYNVSYTVAGGTVTGATIDGQAAAFSSDGSGNWFITATNTNSGSQGIAIQIVDKSDGAASGKVQVLQGKGGELAELLDDMTNSTSGPLSIIEDNYDDIIDNIDKKIESEQARLDRMEYNYKLKWARLEAVLGNYDQLSQSLSSQLAQLDS